MIRCSSRVALPHACTPAQWLPDAQGGEARAGTGPAGTGAVADPAAAGTAARPCTAAHSPTHSPHCKRQSPDIYRRRAATPNLPAPLP